MAEFPIMKQILENTGLYTVSEGSLAEAELKAYAAGLDICFDALEELERECFIATAESYGLEYREAMMHRLNLQNTLSARRNALLKAFSITACDYTPEGMEKVRDIFNAHGTFTFDSASHTITFHCTDALTQTEQTFLAEQMGSLMPLWAKFTFETDVSG